MTKNCEKEILGLHRFFEAWFIAKLPDNDEAFKRVSNVLSPDFMMVTPSGKIIDRSSLLTNLRSMNGFYLQEDQPSSIWIKKINHHWVADNYSVANYEEWQGNKDRTKGKGRISSALFEEHDDAVNEVRWVHLHETWIT